MFTPAKKQLKWLDKISRYVDMRVAYYHAQVFNGSVHLCKTDGYRLHVIPAPGLEADKRYDWQDGKFVIVSDKVANWVPCVPQHFTLEHEIKRETKKVLKTRMLVPANVCWHIYPVDKDTPVYLDFGYFYDATRYDRTCTIRYSRSTRPVRFDYEDGSLAVVMPLNPDAFVL